MATAAVTAIDGVITESQAESPRSRQVVLHHPRQRLSSHQHQRGDQPRRLATERVLKLLGELRPQI
jgi:hypothetical protein